MDRLLRSTMVPMADRPVPMIRSPSQCPGTARSAASAGRSLITTSAVTWPCGLLLRPRSWFPQRPARAQARHQFAFERTPPLDVQRLVDRLVADAHGLIIGEIDLQPVADLLRTPRRRPPSVLAVRLVQAFPRGWPRSGDDRAVGPADLSGQSLLHVVAQLVVARKLRCLRSLRGLLRLPLRDQRSVLLFPAPGRRVAAQLARDRPRVAAEPARDLTHTDVLGPQ